MRLIVWGLVSGFVVSAIVTYWPATWEYAPGVVFGAVIALYFAIDIWKSSRNKASLLLKCITFIAWSYLAYAFALKEAEWILGTNGFASFDSYSQSTALAALFVGCFVGGCLGAFVLALGMRTLFFRFDIVRGLFMFSIFAGMLGSVIAAGFEAFGFIPQFLFPAWHMGVMWVVWYLRENAAEEEQKKKEGKNTPILPVEMRPAVGS